MRKDSKYLTFRFNESDQKLKQELINYLNSNLTVPQHQQIKQILTLGLAILNGEYHDHELAGIERQVRNLSMNMNAHNKISQQIISALADLQDTFTGQISDVDTIITPTTKQAINKRKKQKPASSMNQNSQSNSDSLPF